MIKKPNKQSKTGNLLHSLRAVIKWHRYVDSIRDYEAKQQQMSTKIRMLRQ